MSKLFGQPRRVALFLALALSLALALALSLAQPSLAC